MKRRMVLLQRPLPGRRRGQPEPPGESGPKALDLNGMLATLIRQVVEQALARPGGEDQSEACACGLSDKSRKEMSHLVGLLQDVGEGSLPRGLEHLRETIKTHLARRRSIDRAGMAMATILIGALTSAGLAALWLGLQHHLAQRAGS